VPALSSLPPSSLLFTVLRRGSGKAAKPRLGDLASLESLWALESLVNVVP